jgi:hypothetical protein
MNILGNIVVLANVDEFEMEDNMRLMLSAEDTKGATVISSVFIFNLLNSCISFEKWLCLLQ